MLEEEKYALLNNNVKYFRIKYDNFFRREEVS
jgi:hypothetical protein